ncbi:phage tail protein [Pectobacterium odoriferum]|uniref:phage tail protein n=1 Tax=Pectobacterium odoriferum TaxID=78398 RepID=UPI0021560BBA|nr:phage tail protein [Pectobacterium odoriferum]
MANLSEQESWIDGIYQLETSDPVVAGPGGISNRQAEQLASRTAYLKKMQETTGESLQVHLAASDPHSQYAPKNSPALTGTPTAPTTAQTANNTQIATTAFVKSALAALVNGSPAALDTLQELANALGNDPHFSTTVVNAIADVKTDVANKLNAHASILDAHPQYAPKASPAFTGTPTAPTAASGSNDTQLATTAFVKAAMAALVNGSPAALDTLQELANALGNDPNFSTTVLNALAGKLAKDQNGADIPNKPLFRENVGLVKQTSPTDTTVNRILNIAENGEGSFGLGGAAIAIPAGSAIPGYFNSRPTGFYRAGSNITGTFSPICDYQWIRHDSNNGFLIAMGIGALGVIAFRALSAGEWSGWRTVWHDGNLTSADMYGNRGPLGTVDLDTVFGSAYRGVWDQGTTANATVARNYPIPSAGSLEVIYNAATGVGVVQRYTTHASNRVFIRFKATNNDAWSAWVEHWTSANLTNPMTTDTAQTISGVKTLTANPSIVRAGFPGIEFTNSSVVANVVGRYKLLTSPTATLIQIYSRTDSETITGQTVISIPTAATGTALVTGNNVVADANGYYKTLRSTEITPISANDIAGIPLPFPGAVAPAGWLKCNGQQFDKAQYPILTSRYPSGFLPDLRGEFVRGWDDGRGADAGRALLSAQGDAIRNITGSLFYGYDADTNVPTNNSSTGATYYDTSVKIPDTDNYMSVVQSPTAMHWYPSKFDASRVVPTANETRPRNIAFNYIVRAA